MRENVEFENPAHFNLSSCGHDLETRFSDIFSFLTLIYLIHFGGHFFTVLSWAIVYTIVSTTVSLTKAVGWSASSVFNVPVICDRGFSALENITNKKKKTTPNTRNNCNSGKRYENHPFEFPKPLGSNVALIFRFLQKFFIIFQRAYFRFWAKRNMYWFYYDACYFFSVCKQLFTRNPAPIFKCSIFSEGILDRFWWFSDFIVVFLIIGKRPGTFTAITVSLFSICSKIILEIWNSRRTLILAFLGRGQFFSYFAIGDYFSIISL